MNRSSYERHIAPVNRTQHPMYVQNPDGSGSWIYAHPWMTFGIILVGLSTIGAIFGANR